MWASRADSVAPHCSRRTVALTAGRLGKHSLVMVATCRGGIARIDRSVTSRRHTVAFERERRRLCVNFSRPTRPAAAQSHPPRADQPAARLRQRAHHSVSLLHDTM